MKVYKTLRGWIEGRRDLRLAPIGRNVAHDGLQLGEDLGLAQGELDILLLVVKGGDHVFDLRRRRADMAMCTDASGGRAG